MTRSVLGMRVTGLLLSAIGLGPLLWSGITNDQVRRLAILDPIMLIAVCALAASAAPDKVLAGLDTLRRWLLKPSDQLFSVAVFLWIVVLGSAFAWYCFGGQAVVTDEYTQAFHGQVLRAGRLAAHGERYREFFETAQTVRVTDRWFSEYPIGGPVLAAIGDAMRLPWLINPLIAAFASFALYRFARGAYGITTARLSAVLFALSPFVLFMSGSRMTHVSTLAAALLALAALTAWTETEQESVRQWAAAAIGLGIGVMVLFRPYDAVLVAVPVGVFQLFAIRRSPSLIRSLSTQTVVALALVALQLAVNWKTTGQPLLFGYETLNGPAHRPGFHVDPLGRSFTPHKGLIAIAVYFMDLNTVLFESAIPAMLFVVGALLMLRQVSRWDWLLIGLIGTTVAGYWAYWFDGRFLGPRFLFLAVPAFIILSARFVAAWWRRADGNRVVRATALLVLPASIALAWLPIAVRNRPTGVWLRAFANKYYVSAPGLDVNQELREAGVTNALIFIHEPLHRRLTARLRALGMAPYFAERVVPDLDACGLLEGLAAADTMRSVPDSERLSRALERARRAGAAQPLPGLEDSRSLALAGGRPSTQSCAAEIAGDSVGIVAFEPFLARAEFDDDGRLGGNVVFARDMGARDTVLRARFGDRRWYRYRREYSGAGARAVFTPYR
jgi:hypothetical protein